jgi:2-polyprenyl-3-methyl-5-hydroxy-6-metoxy-1,4-benzoquinol methylase
VTRQQTNPYIFGDPTVDRQRLDAIANVYGEHIRSHAYEYVGKAVKRIIDVGCGEGQLGFALLSMYPGAELVGIDRDERALVKARQSAAERGLNASFVQGDIQDGLPAGQYDVALVFTVLEHVPRYAQALDHIVAALGPGGHIWVQDIASADCFDGYPNPDFQRAANIYLQAMKSLGNNMRIMDELPALLAARGMKNVASHAIDYLVGGHTQDGQYMLANIVGGLYAARGFLSKMTGVSETEIAQIMERIADDALLNNQPGYLRAMNVVARKAEA